MFTVKLQGASDTQGYPVNFTGKIFAVQALWTHAHTLALSKTPLQNRVK